MNFSTITFKGFEALVTARIANGYNEELAYLEIAGAEASVKAIWARLVSAKTKKTGIAEGVDSGGDGIRVEQHTKYLSMRTVLANGQYIIGLLHPRATVIKNASPFYLIVPVDHSGPPTEFFPRLAQSLAVPIREAWAPWLWEKGLVTGTYGWQKLICKLTSSGHAVGYRVQTHDAEEWLKLIQEGIGFKMCGRCSKPAKELVEHKTIVGYTGHHDKVEMICQECKKGVPDENAF